MNPRAGFRFESATLDYCRMPTSVSAIAHIENWPIWVNGSMSVTAMFRQLTDGLSPKYQRPAVERAKPFCLVCRELRRLDSRKTPTLFAGMGFANKYPWTDPQPADANSLR